MPDADDTAGALIALKNLALAESDSLGPVVRDRERMNQSEPGAQATGVTQTVSKTAPHARAWGSVSNIESTHARARLDMAPNQTSSGITLADQPPVARDDHSPEPHASACAASQSSEYPRGLKPAAQEIAKSSAMHGVKWLIDLQNKDGGIPTFCRGWGKLPFDQSTPDLTAHALRAWSVWKNEMPDNLQMKIVQSTTRALRFLLQNQMKDGSWVPLWFGNQSAPDQHNPVYGTSRVLRVDEEIIEGQFMQLRWIDARRRGLDWMVSVQNQDGGWGGDRSTPSSIEETALAIDALAHCLLAGTSDPDQKISQAVDRGYQWLVKHTVGGTTFDPSPMGLYFAKLWYKEDLYPVVFTLAAIGQVHEVAKRNSQPQITQYA